MSRPQTPRSPGLPLPLAPISEVGGRLWSLVGLTTLLVVTLVIGIWQKNQIDGTLASIARLEQERTALESAISQTEVEIASLSSYDRVVPRAESEIGLVMIPAEGKVYLPVAAPGDPAAPPADGAMDQLVASVRGAIDWASPGTSTAEE